MTRTRGSCGVTNFLNLSTFWSAFCSEGVNDSLGGEREVGVCSQVRSVEFSYKRMI